MSDKLPPHNIEFEQGLLGSLLLSGNQATLWEFVSQFPDEGKLFYDLRHADVYRAIKSLADSRKPVDLLTVTEEFSKGRDVTEEDKALIRGLPDASPSSANMTYYASELEGLAQRRELIRVATRGATLAYDGDADALESTQRDILAIGQRSAEHDTTMRELCAKVIAEWDESFLNKGQLRGIPTGFQSFDTMTRGLKPGQLFVVGARPSHGKTSLGLNIVDHVAVRCGIPTGIFSLEMTQQEITKRLLCARAGVSSGQLERAELVEAQFKSVTVAVGQISKAPVFIRDPSGITIHQLQARARRMMHQHQIKLLIVDYLQLLHGRNQQNRNVEMTEVSNGLKNLAKELGVPIIALAQLNREYDKDQGREPRLSDLRDSGSIEQDADIVALLHPRPPENGDDCDDTPTDLLVKKHRNGRTGKIPLIFRKQFTRFEEQHGS